MSLARRYRTVESVPWFEWGEQRWSAEKRVYVAEKLRAPANLVLRFNVCHVLVLNKSRPHAMRCSSRLDAIMPVTASVSAAVPAPQQ